MSLTTIMNIARKGSILITPDVLKLKNTMAQIIISNPAITYNVFFMVI
jgi:hypothetical protein